MFEDMHPGWIPHKKREDKAIALFGEALDLLKENKKNYFGLTMGDKKFAIVCHTKNKDNEYQFGTLGFESEQTGKTVLGLLDLVEDILERQGLIVVIYEGHDFYQSLQGSAKDEV